MEPAAAETVPATPAAAILMEDVEHDDAYDNGKLWPK